MRLGRVCGLLVLASLALACSEEPVPDPIRPVRAMQVEGVAGWQSRWFPGQAKATQEVNLAFEVPGKVVERVDVGVELKQGEVLARLDPRDFQNRLAAATATQEQSRAYLARITKAVETGAVSRQDYDDAKARYDVAQAEVRIRAKDLEDATIRAPFDGEVSATFVENHQNVQAKQRILRLLDTRRVEMVIHIPESMINNSPYVRDLVVRFDAAPGIEIPADVKEVSSEASATTRTYPVTLIFDPPEGVEIKAGMAGEGTAKRLELPEANQEGVEIPVAAVFSEEGATSQQSYVWRIEEASMTVSRHPVEELGFSRGGVLVGGLDEGTWIATAGVHYLREGQKVRFLD
jgi:RND family efflux transporter MFP subunit